MKLKKKKKINPRRKGGTEALVVETSRRHHLFTLTSRLPNGITIATLFCTLVKVRNTAKLDTIWPSHSCCLVSFSSTAHDLKSQVSLRLKTPYGFLHPTCPTQTQQLASGSSGLWPVLYVPEVHTTLPLTPSFFWVEAEDSTLDNPLRQGQVTQNCLYFLYHRNYYTVSPAY